jgi:hypothetical protein
MAATLQSTSIDHQQDISRMSIVANPWKHRTHFSEHTIAQNEYYPVPNMCHTVVAACRIQLIKQTLMENNLDSLESTRTKFLKIVRCNWSYAPIRQASRSTCKLIFHRRNECDERVLRNCLVQDNIDMKTRNGLYVYSWTDKATFRNPTRVIL